MEEFISQRGVRLNKKGLSILLVFTLLLLATTVLSMTAIQPVHAQATSTLPDVKVDHQITVLDGGLVTLSDKVTLSPIGGNETLLDSFRIGFPYKYRSNIYSVIAYESQNPEQRLTLDLDVGLDTPGIYAVKVNFGSQINLTQVGSYIFTVKFEFSSLITAEAPKASVYLFDLDFPVYPSLEQEASLSNTTVFLPPNANYSSSTVVFTQTTAHTLNLVKAPLEAFKSVEGTLQFKSLDSFSLLEVDQARREIVLDEWNGFFVSDFLTITSRATRETSTLWSVLPPKAYGVKIRDDIGNELPFTNKTVGEATKVTMTLKAPLEQNQTAHISVVFTLPWKDHVTANGWNDFSLSFKLFEQLNLTVQTLTVTVNLPEGADFQSSNALVRPDVAQAGIYQETPIFRLSNISSTQDLAFTVRYKHVVFWASFRSTLWTGALVAVIGAFVFLWQFGRAPSPIPTGLAIHPDELRNYVKTYEDQRKLLQERESLEAQARKGKIPRRLYRVRSRTLESRLSVLSRDLASLRDKIRAAGPRYSEMMRQVEVAQTELQGVEADIRRTEARFKRGEISAEAYHKLLEDAYRRRDRAKTNIEGVLLRLREEIS